MPISVTCPGCSKVIKVPEQYAGKSGKCPGCGAKIAIPHLAAAPSAAAVGASLQPAPSPAPQPAAPQAFDPQAFNFTATKAKAPPAAAPQVVAAPVATNPYASPAAIEEPVVNPETTANASQNRRFVNWLIDNVAVQVLSSAAGIFIGSMLAPPDGMRPNPGTAEMAGVLGIFAGLFVFFAYYFVLEVACQKTLGKIVTGTKVVRLDGGRPSLLQCLGRTAARFIPFEPFSFLGSKEPRGWHDRLSGTRVVRQ